MPDTILLGGDPFTNDLRVRLQPLAQCLQGMVHHGIDSSFAAGYMHVLAQLERPLPANPREILAHRRELAADILYSGYDPNRWQTDPAGSAGPPRVFIDGCGQLWPEDGTHRMALLLCRGNPVTVQVHGRHKNWLTACEQTYYEPYPHPDLATRKPLRKSWLRVEAIAAALQRLKLKRVIDVGCNTGCVPTILKDQGFSVLGIESNPHYHRLAGTYAALGYRQIKYHEGSALDFVGWSWAQAVLLLSVLHHIAVDTYTARLLLERLPQTPAIFVELPADADHRYHATLRKETDGLPGSWLLAQVQNLGKQRQRELIFTDDTYEGRKTWLFY